MKKILFLFLLVVPMILSAQTKPQTTSFNLTEAETGVDKCSDGCDNDGDGFVDCADLDCFLFLNGLSSDESVSRSSTECDQNTCILEYIDLIQKLEIQGTDQASTVCVKINELLDILKEDELALIRSCMQPEDDWIWEDLVAFQVPETIKNQIESRGNGWFVHDLRDAEGTVLNVDYYAVEIDEFPEIDGESITAQDFFDYIRLNFLDLDDGCNTTFKLGEWTSTNEDENIWSSNNPLGAVVDIDIGFNYIVGLPDDATVVTSQYANMEPNSFAWTFSTISSPDVLLSGNGDHPVSGHRQFGLTLDPNTGKWIFYTRAVDRVTDDYMTFGLLPSITNMAVLGGGDDLWKCLTENVAEFVYGDNVNIDDVRTIKINRPNWDEIKENILNMTTTEILGCYEIDLKP